jgi:CRP/FNR family transcriptional regulator, anaerobic regulatory protein
MEQMLPDSSVGAAAAPTEVAVFNPQARVCLDCSVRRHALFGMLDAHTLHEIHWRIADLHFTVGQNVYAAGEAGPAAYTVREGVVRLERLGERGERHIVRLAGRGDLIGMEALLGQTYATTAVACTPVKTCRLPRALVEEMAEREPAIVRGLMQRWQAALDDTDEWLTELLTGSARWRMLRLLLKLSEYGESNGRVWLPTRQEMGAMLGMTVETASRLVSQLRREGVLKDEGARHAVLAMDQLMAALRSAAAET